MDMYYKIPVDSVTGGKMLDYKIKCLQVTARMLAVRRKYGFTRHFIGPDCIVGGTIAVVFPDGKTDAGVPIDLDNAWKPDYANKDSFIPRGGAIGKAITQDFWACGYVKRVEFSDIFGFDSPFCFMGYNILRDDVYGMTVPDSWHVEVPADAAEITKEEYKKLFD